MKDDDLESLLGDVDGSLELKSFKDEDKRSKERIARKSDKNIGSSSEEQSKSMDDTLSDEEISAAVAKFKNGYINALQCHALFAGTVNKALNDPTHHEVVQIEIRKYKYNLSRYIENIDTLYDKFVTGQNEDTLQRKAKQDFSLFFDSSVATTNHVNFLILKEIFLRIREFNSRIRKEWNDLSDSLTFLSFMNEGKLLYQQCSIAIKDALGFCKTTDKFLKFLANVLAIPQRDFDVVEKDIANKIFYYDNVTYSFSDVINRASFPKDTLSAKGEDYLDLDAEKGASAITEELAFQETKEAVIPESEEVIIPEPPMKPKSAPVIPNFTLRGAMSWNTQEPYIIKVDDALLVKDRENLKSVIYFNDNKYDDLKIQGNVKRALFLYTKTKKIDITASYNEFIFKTIVSVVQNLKSISASKFDSDLFIYHLGPLTVYRIVVDIFESTGIGTCYKLVGENRVAKLVPNEFIKLKVLNWFEENINVLDLPFDKTSEFNEIKKVLAEMYNAEMEAANRRVFEIERAYFLKNNQHVDKRAVFEKNKREILGSHKIMVYRRFLGVNL